MLLYNAYGSKDVFGFKLYGFLEEKRNLEANENLKLSTYFNAFFPVDWYEATSLQSIYLDVSIKGKGKVFLKGIYQEDGYFYEETLNQIDFTDSYEGKIFFPENWPKYNIIYPEILSTTGISNFQLSYCSSTSFEEKKISIGVVICTYNRATFLKKILESFANIQLKNINLHICIVDNAKNLHEQELKKIYKNLTLLHNKNTGGSGGFTRGMLFFYKTEVDYILLLDDDIYLDERIFERLKSILQLIKKEDFAISGSMFDSLQPHVLYETSAKINFNKLKYKAINYLSPLKQVTDLIKISIKERIEYGAWWFFLFPKSFLDEFGYSYPFFIRVDDVEFSYRILAKKIPIYRFFGIGIWHEPFYAKDPIWIHYYTVRNLLILSALYSKGFILFQLVKLWAYFVFQIFTFRYIHIEYYIKAIGDYLKGPNFLKNLDTEKFHSELVSFVKSDLDFQRKENIIFIEPSKLRQTDFRDKFGIVKLFLHGFKQKQTLQYDPFTKELKIYKRNWKRGILLFAKYLSLTLQLLVFSFKVKKDYISSHKTFVSPKFWENYLELRD
jgi:galactofuranosylgalactofuranosylrhamnosyl-N-acetylglucosaminyl-diphospho-decaprenol beta-1,5/1,6-galactofuranosyltransferase